MQLLLCLLVAGILMTSQAIRITSHLLDKNNTGISAAEADGISDDEMEVEEDADEAAGRKLTVTTILEPPYMMLKADSAFLAGNDRFEGYLADILRHLAAAVNFQYEIRLARDAKHGVLYRDTVWDGMMGEIQRREADIAAGALIVTEQRRRFVDFSEPFLSLRSSALVSKSPSRVSRSTSRPSSRPTTTTTSPRRQIQTADQLLSSDLSYGVVRNSVVERVMAESTDPLTRALWSRVATFWPPAFVDSLQEGVERARRENFAFIVDSPMAAYIAGRKPCDLYSTEPFLDQMLYSFAVSRDQRALRQGIDREIRRLKNTGQMQQMYLRWWRDECTRTPAHSAHIPTQSDVITVTSGAKVNRQAGGGRGRSCACDVTAGTVAICLLLIVSLFVVQDSRLGSNLV